MQNQHNTHQRSWLVRYWWLLLVGCTVLVSCPVLAAYAAFTASAQTVAIYSASVSLLVQHSTGDDNQLTEKTAHTYAQMLTERPVLEATINKLMLNETWEELEARTTAKVVSDTQMIQLSVEDTDSARAAAVANTIANEFITQNQASDNLIILEQAQVPTIPVRPHIALSTVLGGVAGMVLAVGFIILLIMITVRRNASHHDFNWKGKANKADELVRILSAIVVTAKKKL